MERTVGTVVRGIRCPIIRQGDDLAKMVAKSVLDAAKAENFELRDRDIVAVTEAVVARAQGNYATVDDIAADVRAKFKGQPFAIVFPILSRNRFAICLSGIAKGADKAEITLVLSYPSDEVGNHLVSIDALDEKEVNPWSDVMDEKEYREKFGYVKHPFTGVDYVEYYSSLIKEYGSEVEIIFANNPKVALNYTKNVLACDIHTRERTKRILKNAGAEKVYGLDEILRQPNKNSGCNPDYGLLGSNKATENSVKLFPRDCDKFVAELQKLLFEATGKKIETMVYGDGAFKDPVGKIWELADPVVSPAYTSGLIGQPNELKLKYLADNQFADLSGDELKKAITERIAAKSNNLVGSMESQGTTPRRLTDLIGSLCDLTSGSGDKGTPAVLIQGYFDNYSNK